MQVELAGDEVFASDLTFHGKVLPGVLRLLPGGLFRRAVRQRPLAFVQLHELSAQGNACELLEKQPALAAAAQAKLADELLVTGAVGGAALDHADELAVGLGIGRGEFGHRLILFLKFVISTSHT